MKTEEGKNAMAGDEITDRPSLAYFHPNAKGTGSAIKFSLYPNTIEHSGYIRVEFAKQCSIGDLRCVRPIYPKFDWDNKIELCLDINDVSEVIEVLRGISPCIRDGYGVVTVNYIRFNVIHDVDLDCYKLTIENEHGLFSISLYSHEALGLEAALSGAMTALAFGKIGG